MVKRIPSSLDSNVIKEAKYVYDGVGDMLNKTNLTASEDERSQESNNNNTRDRKDLNRNEVSESTTSSRKSPVTEQPRAKVTNRTDEPKRASTDYDGNISDQNQKQRSKRNSNDSDLDDTDGCCYCFYCC